jgi:hypothetical protein
VILFDSSVIIDARDADSPFQTWAKERIAWWCPKTTAQLS